MLRREHDKERKAEEERLKREEEAQHREEDRAHENAERLHREEEDRRHEAVEREDAYKRIHEGDGHDDGHEPVLPYAHDTSADFDQEFYSQSPIDKYNRHSFDVD